MKRIQIWYLKQVYFSSVLLGCVLSFQQLFWKFISSTSYFKRLLKTLLCIFYFSSPQTFCLLFMHRLCQSISRPDTFWGFSLLLQGLFIALQQELATWCVFYIYINFSRSSWLFPFPALTSSFLRLLWMEVSSCHLLPLKQSQLFNTRRAWGETKWKGRHFWRREDVHVVISSIQCDVSVGMGP